ncbi:hypothetical protein ASPZODRAFT_134612 [Penicilliopsis zonata CBS 506.65]|uniref:Rhodopsin domain-containing protein n=1 Tax=Penicilliopsis zonata CBS 506.65 TaxID=1073090 RepID=A0A1L9SBI8_9EURO|nr:hypothetical protein ASPZODRAFT_134612 [Penicilliopsis zonata CBS 506.65]OJJ44531.1 hypothetical protein ASPZODRAFT_134612 [Penicilliopsis zonata CBS 506.65]
MAGTSAPYGISNYGTTLVIVSWTEFGICLVLLLARTYTTWAITKRIRLDLYLAVFTFITATLSLCFFTLSILYGLGQHISVLSTQQATEAMKWAWSNTLVSLFAISGGKFAVVAFLHQLHGPQDRGKKIFLWTLASSNLIMNTITVGTILGTCMPAAKLWDSSLPGTCDGGLRNQNCAYFQGSWSAFVDMVLAIYPAIFFWNVQLQPLVKIGLCVLMGMGIIASVCAIAKTVELSALTRTEDTTYFIGRLDIWNTTEMWVILIVGCIPPIRPLIVRILKKVSSTVYTRSYPRSGTELRNYYASGTGHNHGRTASQKFQSQSGTNNDNDSEENILKGDGTITRTTNIDVTYWHSNGSSEAVDQPNGIPHAFSRHRP